MERSLLGKRIAAACALKGITMGTLADKIGVTRNTLSRIVRGVTEDPASSIIVRIARELGVTTDYLLGMDMEDEKEEEHPYAA
jgi:transcriptional regulator with XRE-family HTH domain